MKLLAGNQFLKEIFIRPLNKSFPNVFNISFAE
uniref:Uncharacterized protein n=1 Tax=Anguilla anguilla TaxID=7936 RepID=A0A0E9U1Y2_ANGAN